MQKKPSNKTKSQRKRRTIQPFGIKMDLDLKDLGKSLSKLSDEIGNKVDKTVKSVSRQVSKVLSAELKKFESRLGQIEKRLGELSLPGKAKTRRRPRAKVKKAEPQPKKRGRKPSTKTCSVRGCNEKHLAKGLCRKHYWQMKGDERKKAKVKEKATSKVSKPKSKKSLKGKKICTVEGCDNPYLARGYCKKHYEQWRKGKLK